MSISRPTLYGSRHAISAGHYLAASAGFAILEAGGNAIDAGCAAGIALGVLLPDLVNVAGVAPIMKTFFPSHNPFTLDDQSSAFFNPPGTLRLYSGVAITTPSAARIASQKAAAAAGVPALSVSSLKSGISPNSATSN